MYVLSDKTRYDWVRRKLLSLPKGQSILDAGAGEQAYKKFCMHLRYTSQDFNKYKGINKYAEGLHPKKWNTSDIDIVSDITNIPVKDKSFDNVLCTEVLEHVLYPEQVIQELSRVLKGGGKLILTAPFASQTHFAPYFYYTGYSKYWYKEILKKYNFSIKTFSANGNYFEYLVQELLRLPFMIKRYSKFKWLGFILYCIILPFFAVLMIISKLSKGSEYQLCFGWHIVAKKNKNASKD